MQLATLMSALIVSNMFGPLGLAKFGIVQTTITTAAAVLPFGLGYTAVSLMNNNQDDIFKFQVATFVYQICLISSLISSVALFLMSDIVTHYFFAADNVSFYIAIAAAGLPFATIAVIQYALLNGFKAYADMALSSYISTSFTAVIIILSAYFTDLTGTIFGFVSSLIIRALVLQYFLNKYFRVNLSLPSYKVWTRIKNFAIPVGIAGLSMAPSTWYSNSLLIKYEGLQSQGIMMAALTIRMAISFIPQQLSTVLLPTYLQYNVETRINHIKIISTYIALLGSVSAFISLTAFLFRDHLIAFFGSGFRADPHIMGLLLVSVTLDALATPLSHVHAKYEKMWRFTLISSLPRDLFFLLICLYLIPIYGALGMAVAFSISSLICTILVGASALAIIFNCGK